MDQYAHNLCLPDLTAEEKRLAARNQEKCKSALEADARRQREIWAANRVEQIKLATPNQSVQYAASIVQRAADRRELSGEFQVVVQMEGKELSVTIEKILTDPSKFDGLLTLDPLEPEYDGRRFVGKLFVAGARPNLFSFAHGGTNYRLKHDVRRIEVLQGRVNLAIDGLMSAMRDSQEIYDFGQKLVQIQDDGKLHQMTDHTLRYFAGGLVQFFKVINPSDGPSYELLVDPPINVCKAIVELKDGRKLKPLNGLITAPTLREDGSLLVSAGYDASTRLFFDQKNRFRPYISHAPSLEEASKAIDTLWAPFKDFPFCSAVDRAVHLAALITAAVRAVLPAAPGFAYDAPIQGSGKTLLARCVGVLAQGAEPSVWPHTTNANDEEIAARLAHSARSHVMAIHVCRHDQPSTRDARVVLRSIAFQMATQLGDYREQLLRLARDQIVLEDLNASEIFSRLLANPLAHGVGGQDDADGRRLIVIDGLDESIEGGKSELLNIISSEFRRLPAWLGFVVTSRPEAPVKRQLGSFGVWHQEENDPRNQEDLANYIRSWLKTLPIPRDQEATALDCVVRACDGMFLYLRKLQEAVDAGLIPVDQLMDPLSNPTLPEP